VNRSGPLEQYKLRIATGGDLVALRGAVRALKWWRLLFPQLAANVAEFHAKLPLGSRQN